MNIKLKPIQDQVIVLVGASSGIGRLAAKRLAGRGARVVVSARSTEGLDSLVDEIRRDGGEAFAVTADVAHWEQVQSIAETALSTYGRIDSWVQLSAVSVYAPFEETTSEMFHQVIAVNLLGGMHGAKAALPHLKAAGGGALVIISSVEAAMPVPLTSVYSASKHGLRGFLDALRMELHHEEVPVSVTEILPASINTPLFENARTKLGVVPKPLPPVYRPEAVVDAIQYALEHPIDQFVVGGAGKMMIFTERLAPRFARTFMEWFGYKTQFSNMPKSDDAPSNLFSPIPENDRVEGKYSRGMMPISLDTWVGTHPIVRGALMVAGLAALPVLAFVAWRRR